MNRPAWGMICFTINLRSGDFENDRVVARPLSRQSDSQEVRFM
jgi:hypothetical protein